MASASTQTTDLPAATAAAAARPNDAPTARHRGYATAWSAHAAGHGHVTLPCHDCEAPTRWGVRNVDPRHAHRCWVHPYCLECWPIGMRRPDALFHTAGQYSLTVAVRGAGSGRVSMIDAGEPHLREAQREDAFDRRDVS